MLSERKQYYLIHFSAPPEDKFLKVNQKLLTKPNQSRLKLRRGGDYVRESLFFLRREEEIGRNHPPRAWVVRYINNVMVVNEFPTFPEIAYNSSSSGLRSPTTL